MSISVHPVILDKIYRWANDDESAAHIQLESQWVDGDGIIYHNEDTVRGEGVEYRSFIYVSQGDEGTWFCADEDDKLFGEEFNWGDDGDEFGLTKEVVMPSGETWGPGWPD